MSRNKKAAVVAGADVQDHDGVAEETVSVTVVQLTQGAKVNGRLERAGTYLTDIDDKLAREIVASGAGEYVTVGLPVDAVFEEPASGDGAPTAETA